MEDLFSRPVYITSSLVKFFLNKCDELNFSESSGKTAMFKHTHNILKNVMPY